MSKRSVPKLTTAAAIVVALAAGASASAAAPSSPAKVVGKVYILDDLAPDAAGGKTNYRAVFRTSGDIRERDEENLLRSTVSLSVPGLRAVGSAGDVRPLGKVANHCWSVILHPRDRSAGSQVTRLARKKSGTRLKTDFRGAARQRVTATLDSTPGSDAAYRYKDRYKSIGCPLG